MAVRWALTPDTAPRWVCGQGALRVWECRERRDCSVPDRSLLRVQKFREVQGERRSRNPEEYTPWG